MSTTVPFLVSNPPAVPQYRHPRREEPSGVVVVHTAENIPDTIAADGGAEAVANFIRHRTDPGSYHDLVDSDSWVPLVRYEDEAFHDATGSNRHSYGISMATRADLWPELPEAWRNATVRNAAKAVAQYAQWLYARRGIVIPPRLITRQQSDGRIPGFISHHERDPERRTDPGATFPWTTFLYRYAYYTSLIFPNPPAPDMEGTETMRILDCQGEPALLVSGNEYKGLTPEERNAFRRWGIEAGIVSPKERQHIIDVLNHLQQAHRLA